ncbi:MAG: glycine cleavage system protein GcvH [Alphaproteobacteria bacterium]
MADVKYTEDHEWVSLDGEEATIGITDHAQEQLGEVVFVELPEIGKKVKKGDVVAVVESVKAASEIFAPVAGEISEANPALEDDPGLVNGDAEGEAWFFRMIPDNPEEIDDLMDASEYSDLIDD